MEKMKQLVDDGRSLVLGVLPPEVPSHVEVRHVAVIYRLDGGVHLLLGWLLVDSHRPGAELEARLEVLDVGGERFPVGGQISAPLPSWAARLRRAFSESDSLGDPNRFSPHQQ